MYFIWLKYVSWFTYANEILVVNQWRRVTNIGKILITSNEILVVCVVRVGHYTDQSKRLGVSKSCSRIDRITAVLYVLITCDSLVIGLRRLLNADVLQL